MLLVEETKKRRSELADFVIKVETRGRDCSCVSASCLESPPSHTTKALMDPIFACVVHDASLASMDSVPICFRCGRQ